MKNSLPALAVIVLLIVSLLAVNVACGGPSVITTVETLATAAEAAVTALEVAGTIPPSVGQVIAEYLGEIATAAQQAATLAQTESGAKLASDVVALFVNIQLSDVPPQYQFIVQGVAQAVSQLLKYFTPASFPAKSPVLSVSNSQKKKLAALSMRFKVVNDRINLVKAKAR